MVAVDPPPKTTPLILVVIIAAGSGATLISITLLKSLHVVVPVSLIVIRWKKVSVPNNDVGV